jgi:hypothetical protein
MCEKLRLAAYNLEMVAKNAPQDVAVSNELSQELRQKFHELQVAALDINNFVETIQSIKFSIFKIVYVCICAACMHACISPATLSSRQDFTSSSQHSALQYSTYSIPSS